MEITKELLSLVLDEEIGDGFYVDTQSNIVKYGLFSVSGCTSLTEEINLDTLARLCKEWCNKNHYSVLSGWQMTHWGGAYEVVVKQGNIVFFSQSTHDTELKAIISAMQWVEDNI